MVRRESYLKRVGSSISQLINTILLNGDPDESISSRSYRLSEIDNGRTIWRYMRVIIDAMFRPFEADHCRKAYLADIERARQLISL